MSVNYLAKISDFIKTHRTLVTGVIVLLILGSLISLKFIKYNNNIELMLPADSQVQQSMRFLRESNFSDKLVIDLKLNDSRHNTQDLILATDRLADAILPAAGSRTIANEPLVKQVTANIGNADFMQEMILFLQYTPQLLRPESLINLDNRLTPTGIKERLAFIYRQTLTPQSSFIIPFLRADPLNLSSGILSNIQKLSQSSGYQVTINQGHFISQDGRHAMLIVKTSVLLTDGFGSRKIINYLREKFKTLPGYITAEIIAGHMHTIKNEDIIKNDIRITSVIAALGFILLFLFIFRDWRAIFIFLMPLGGVLITTGITWLIFKNLSYFVIGLSTVIAGITIDYGIYVYMAVRKAGNSLETLNKIIKPLFFGTLTTISVFKVFFFSSVKGYHQLAFFSNFTIILCLGFSIFILPHLIQQKNSISKTAYLEKLPANFKLNIPDRFLMLSWIIVITIMLGIAGQLKFSNDITQFDGVGKEVIKNEEVFRLAWGNHDLPAVFVVSADTLDTAFQINDAVYAQAIKAIGAENFNSLASIWPGRLKRQENLEAWNKFWTPRKKKETVDLLSEYGTAFNFSPDAFRPFINQLYAPTTLTAEPDNLVFFRQLKEQFVLDKKGAYQILSFFPDRDDFILNLSKIKQNFPGTLLVSRKNFSRLVSQALSREFVFLALLSIIITLILMAILLKDLRLTALAIVPVVTSLAVIGGVIRLAGLSLNIPAIIAAMVVIGLVSDYGIFMVYYCKYNYQTGTVTAITLAATTTLIGTGVLLFAQHPILFSIGVTLTTGVLAGYLASLLIIPSLYKIWKDR